MVTERSGNAEVARIGDTLVLVSQGEAVAYGDHGTDGLALLVVEGRRYELRDEGIVTGGGEI